MLELWFYVRRLANRVLPNLRWSFALAGILLSLAPSAFCATFTATLDRNSVVLGETATLTLQFEGGSPQGLPAIPQLPGLAVAQGIQSSMNTSVGPDGSRTSVQSYSLTLVPQRAGDFTIPGLTAMVGGQALQSQPLTLKVLQSDPSAPPAEFADKLAFVWAILPKKEVYVGETFTAEVRLYLRGEVRNISEPQLPALAAEGFNSGKFVEGQQFQRRVGNAAFRIIPLTLALTPVKTGTLGLGSGEGSVIVHLPASRQRGLDPFDIFGPRTEPRKIPLSLERQQIQVLPTPVENRPADFNGAVGVYTMAFSAGPTNVATGDPITIKVQISGEGNLDGITLPQQPGWRNFQLYPPTARVETTDKLGIAGTKFFEQVVVPQSADIKELPPFSFSFFDPNQKRYQTLSHPAIPLVVRPGGASVAPSVVMAPRGFQETPPPSQDIVHIKPRLGAVAQIRAPLVQQPWFIALQGIPLLGWICSIVWRKRVDSLANNPRLRRERQVAQIIRDGLADLRRLGSENKSDEFFATLFHLLQEQLGERLDLPASAITEAVIDEHLRPRHVPDATLAPLHELFQICNLARYAPMKSSQELVALLPKIEAVLRDLQGMKV